MSPLWKKKECANEEGSYPHTPSSPTPSSIQIWEQASEALLVDDPLLGYETRGMEEFAGGLAGGRGIRGWMRGWVEGRTLVCPP
jgi:hypothetical protein